MWLSQLLVVLIMFALCLPAQAQQPKKVARIGYVGSSPSNSAIDMKPFRERLRELGYVEGQNITIESVYFEGKVERLPELAAQLVRLKCDVIFAVGNEATKAAKSATKEIPIVIASTQDAVRSGFVASLARPGGNVTGLTGVGADMSGKRLELLKEVIPKLSRMGFLWSPTSPIAADNLKDMETLARSFGLGIQAVQVKEPDEIEVAFQTAINKSAEALMVDTGGFFIANQKRILELATKSRLPAMYANTRFVEAGGLMSYSLDRKEQFRRAAEYVDKILKGARPADLAIERPRKFELVINLKAAKQIALTIPSNVLAQADKVIK